MVAIGLYDNPVWPETDELEEVRKRGLARHAKWWRRPEGCEGKVSKRPFRGMVAFGGSHFTIVRGSLSLGTQTLPMTLPHILTKLFVQSRKRRKPARDRRLITRVTRVQVEHPQMPGGEFDHTARKVVEDSRLICQGHKLIECVFRPFQTGMRNLCKPLLIYNNHRIT